jgi:Tol biopolymer transport system component
MLLQGLNMHSVAQWSPDGAFVAVYLSESWAIYPAACLLENRQCIPWRLDPAANDTRIAWGPEGTTLGYITDSNSATMKILTRGCWDDATEGCFERIVPVASKGVLRQPAWSADGSRFVFLGLQPRGLFILDAACLDSPAGCIDQMQYVRVNMWPVYWPSLSADGKHLLYFAETGDGVEQLYRTDIESGAVQQISFRAGGGSVPAWSSDGRFIAFAGFQSRSGGDLSIYLFDAERRLTALAIHQARQDFAFPAWNPRP